MAGSLPSKAQLEKAVSDPATLKTLVLQSLNYGICYLGGEPSEDKTQQTGSLLTQAWTSYPEELESLLVDSLWLVSCAIGDTEHKQKALTTVISSLLTVPDRDSFWKDLQATLGSNLLVSTHLIEDKDVLLKKIRRVNTELYYKQQKFNLLQEESEGYAKLLTLLFEKDLSKVTSETLRTFMGTFDLDPNRVLDLLLDVLEETEQKDKVLKLIEDFAVAKIPHLLAFKLSNYHSSNKPIPSSLYSTIVLLAKKDLLNLSLLVPNDLADLHECYRLYDAFMKLRIARLGRISLTTDNRPDPKMVQAQNKLDEASKKLVSQNALAGLLQILLESNDFELCSTLLPDPDDWTKICTLLPKRVGGKLCNWLSTQLPPDLYDANVPTPKLSSAKTNGEKKSESDDDMKTTPTTTLEELLESCSSALVALGQSGCLSAHPVLYCKLCRLAKALLKGKTDNLSPLVQTLMNTVLVPSLSLLQPNPAISADLWSLLSILPYATRYQLYRQWRGGGLERAGMGTKPLLQVQCEMEAGKAARYTLKRLSKDNIRDMGRQVSKVTHANPLVVFSTILNQIESYDNLIQMMVETVRFVTPLSLDVLGYCVLTRLSGTVGGVNRSRLKDDGINVSQWLQSLEGFTGAFYRKCPDVEFRGIMSYLVHRLKDGHVLELGVLKTLMKTAGGFSFADYSPAASLSAQQLEGRAGSLLLKRETFAFGIVDDINFRASARIKSVLQSNNLGVTMLILLAQTRSRLIFEGGGTKKKHVKLIANLLDTCQVVMYILVEFITDSTISRLAKAAGEGTPEESNLDAIESYAAALPTLEQLFDSYKLDAVSAWMLCRPIFRAASIKKAKFEAHSGDRSAIVRRMLPEGSWTHISPDLFDTFFSASLYDIYFPESCYQTELTRLKDTVQRLSQKKKNHQPGVLGMDFSSQDEVTWERSKVAATAIAEDMEKQKKHCETIRTRITATVPKLLPSEEITVAAVQTFITHCVYPRCRLSPDDATYCVRFVMTLHNMSTPGFSTMHFIDEFINVLSGSLFSSTEDEAAAIGIMLLELWKVVSNWRYEESAFQKEVVGKPGAMMVGEEGAAPVSFETFKSLYNKWHATIGRVTIGCLDSTEYMHVRSCFVILTRIVDAFPTRGKLGQKLLDSLEPLQDETYPMQDIKTAAHAYGTLLIKARSNGVWKEEDAAAIKAREEKEKAEDAMKQKRREKQQAEMMRDTEKLNEEIGETGRWDDRDRGRRGPAGDSRRPPEAVNQRDSSGAGNARRENTKENGGDRGRRGGPDAEQKRSDRNQHSDRQGNQSQQSLDGRWVRGQQGGGKRSRSPTAGGDDQPTKRTRTDGRQNHNGPAKFEPPPARRGGGAGPPPPQRGADRGSGGYARRGRR